MQLGVVDELRRAASAVASLASSWFAMLINFYDYYYYTSLAAS